MRTVEIIDPMFGMVADTLRIPANWRFEGTVLHGHGCINDDYYDEYSSLAYRASSPDGRFGVQSIPSTIFYWGTDPGAVFQGRFCKDLPPISAAAYGELVSVRMRPGSEVDSVGRSPGEDFFLSGIATDNPRFAAIPSSGMPPWKNPGNIKPLPIPY